MQEGIPILGFLRIPVEFLQKRRFVQERKTSQMVDIGKVSLDEDPSASMIGQVRRNHPVQVLQRGQSSGMR
jgi:hypothetical protein